MSALRQMLTLLENLDNLEKHDQLDGMALNEALNVKSPLYGHHDEKSAYVVDDYPYGGYRTQIRFWVEAVPRKGFRFVSQTLNPKTNQWNKPKKSTYSDFAGCMYLDDKSHVQFAGLGSYSSATDVLEFARSFPNSGHGTILKKFAATYIKLLSQYMDGSAVCTINGEPRPFSDADQARHKAEYEQWVQVAQLVGGAV